MPSTPQNRYRFVLICNLLLAFALISIFFPPLRAFWESVDHWVFFTFNGSLAEEGPWQSFWAVVSNKRERNVMPAFMVCFHIAYLWKGKYSSFRYKAAQLLFCWLVMQISKPLMDYVVMHLLDIHRASPSIVLEPSVRLSHVFNDTNIRDASAVSFISGHSFIHTFWAAITLLCCSRGFGIAACAIASVTSLPRLMAGAHWLTDSLFGAVLALALFSWLALPSVQQWGTQTMLKVFDLCRSKLKNRKATAPPL